MKNLNITRNKLNIKCENSRVMELRSDLINYGQLQRIDNKKFTILLFTTYPSREAINQVTNLLGNGVKVVLSKQFIDPSDSRDGLIIPSTQTWLEIEKVKGGLFKDHLLNKMLEKTTHLADWWERHYADGPYWKHIL